MDWYEQLQGEIRNSDQPVAFASPETKPPWEVTGKYQCRPYTRYAWRVSSCPFCNECHYHMAEDGWRVDDTAPIGVFRSGCGLGYYKLFTHRAKEMLAVRNAASIRTAINGKLREQVRRKTNGRCWYCGDPWGDIVEHVMPVSLGGSNDISNLVPSCSSCNAKKRTRTLEHFRVACGGGRFWGEVNLTRR